MSNSAHDTRLRSGSAASRGLAAGPVFLYRSEGASVVSERLIESEGIPAELERLHRALLETRRDLEGLAAVLRERTGKDVRVFEGHLMLADDPILVSEVEALIRTERLNAESAVRRTFAQARAQFAQMRDAYFRERVRDLEDVERRILGFLTGLGGGSEVVPVQPSVIVAAELTPSDTLRLPRDRVLGFATDGGSATSHVALLARALGIPAVTGLGDLTARVAPGETVLLDGTAGSVLLQPEVDELKAFAARQARESASEAAVPLEAPAGTLRTGGEVPICANVQPGLALDSLKASGARGIGLYRSEYLWLDREREPTEEEQFAAYRAAAEAVRPLGEDASAVIRLLDIGGDKLVRGLTSTEANPFLGNRSIRYLFTHEQTLRTQLRAILRASAYGRLRLMCPMISCLEEVRRLKGILAEVRRGLDLAHLPYDPALKVGVMIEVPAAALVADALSAEVDFLSIGTNDLVQYTLAADRGNESVSRYCQPTHPAVLSLMRRTIGAAHRHGIPVGVCGESASDPVLGLLWAALGADSLSMAPTYVPVLARALRQFSREDLADYAGVVTALGEGATGAEILSACREWVRARISENVA